jgi:uncharacterized protein (DUF1015 family)
VTAFSQTSYNQPSKNSLNMKTRRNNMKTIALYDIYKAEHEVISKADEWIGMNPDKASEDIDYILGVHDLAKELIEMVQNG